MLHGYLPLIFITVAAIATGIVIYKLIDYLISIPWRRRFVPEEISLMDKWVDRVFSQTAQAVIEYRYKMSGKRTRTKRGVILSRFMSETDKEISPDPPS